MTDKKLPQGDVIDADRLKTSATDSERPLFPMGALARRLASILSARQRRSVALLGVLAAVNSLIQTVSVGLIGLFFAVALDNGAIDNMSALAWLELNLMEGDRASFISLLGVVVAVSALSSQVLVLVLEYYRSSHQRPYCS